MSPFSTTPTTGCLTGILLRSFGRAVGGRYKSDLFGEAHVSPVVSSFRGAMGRSWADIFSRTSNLAGNYG
jgi:hypothetical protein